MRLALSLAPGFNPVLPLPMGGRKPFQRFFVHREKPLKRSSFGGASFTTGLKPGANTYERSPPWT